MVLFSVLVKVRGKTEQVLMKAQSLLVEVNESLLHDGQPGLSWLGVRCGRLVVVQRCDQLGVEFRWQHCDLGPGHEQSVQSLQTATVDQDVAQRHDLQDRLTRRLNKIRSQFTIIIYVKYL